MAPKKEKKGPGGRVAGKVAIAEATAPRPQWPVLKPLLPPSDMEMSTILDGQIVTVKNFWTGTLCKNYVSYLKTLPLVTTPGIPKRGDAVRVNDRYQVIDPGFANRLWIETGLRELVCGGESSDEFEIQEPQSTRADRRQLWGGEVIGLNPSIRIYRYSKGQFFDRHYDESNVLSFPLESAFVPARTTWTLLLYLTSSATGCRGGQTVFYPDDVPNRKSPVEKEVSIELETGMLLLHKHGNDCMLHEGKEVTEGEKWVIRSDLCVRR